MEPGWYPDPYGRLTTRWWDGAHWTGYAADGEVQWDEIPVEEEPRQPGLPGLGIGVGGYIGGVVLAFVIELALVAADEPGGRTVELVASQLGLWTGLIGACFYVSRRRGTGSLRRDFNWGMRWIDVGFGFAGSFVGRIVAGIAVSPIPTSFRRVSTPDRSILERAADGALGWVVLIVITCVGAPLIEELFFRGLLQTRLVDVIGPAGGIIATSALFGAAHLIAWQGALTFVYAVAVAGGGLVLGLMFHLTGRLGPPIWAHVFFNAQAVLAAALLQE